MTARNSILLIIKQQPGIEYTVLLNKISGNYGSIESARAALSRSIRYLIALGMVVKKGNNLFATGKATALLSKEMQNKLLLKLNELMSSKDIALHFDSVVELLQTLIERSKQDKDLLLAAKGSASFYLPDLDSLQKEIEKRIHSMRYQHSVFLQQIESLKQLDFPDFRQLSWSNAAKKSIFAVAKKMNAKVFTVEFHKEAFMQKAMEKFSVKGKQNELFFEAKQLPKLLEFIEKKSRLERNTVNLFIAGIKIKIDYPHVFIIAPSKQLEKLLEKN